MFEINHTNIFSPNETAKTRRHIEADSGLNSAAAVGCSRFRSSRSQFYTCSDFISGFSASISDTLILAADGRTNAPPPPTPILPAPPLTTPLPAQEIRLTPCGHRPAPCNPLGHRRIQQGDGVYDSEIRPNTFSEFRLKRLPPPRRCFLFLPVFPAVFFPSFTDAC